MTEHSSNSDYRLPNNAVPQRYSIHVAPHFEDETFDGDVAIELAITEPTSTIVLNSAELELSRARLQPANAAGAGRSAPGAAEVELRIELDEERQRATFAAPSEIEPGDYVLSVAFAAPLSNKLRGLYRSAFTDDEGNEHVIASTHFESTDARRAFPCFDEPEMKAVFSITLDVPGGLFAVSNAPEAEVSALEGGTRRIRFEDTMKMSTYLVAYCIGPFEATEPVLVEGVPLRVVVPAGKLGLTSFALEAGEHALKWFHRYFDIAYPSQKLDLVAIPDFAMGAMENLGCVTFRESALLCDPEKSSIPELSRIAEVIEHEIAHMWFGDLVTMKWWNGIWLNEAFATFMSLCCLNDFRPEWNRWVSFGTEKDHALGIDALHSTRAIEFPVNAPDECEAMFDGLTYLKGGNVLRMVEQYLGTERFRDGVRLYLKTHAYGNTETTDLWDAIESVSAGEPVRAILDSWIFQGGHPLVTATRDGSEIVLTEERFSYLADNEREKGAGRSAIGSDWLVPVRFESRPGSVEARILGPGPSGTDPLRLESSGGLPVVNAGGSGTYRLYYEGPLFDEILNGLSKLLPLERFNLVADAWACTLARRTELGEFLALVRHLHGDDDPNVWGVVAAAFGLLEFGAAGVAEEPLASLLREVISPELERIGFEAKESDSPEKQRSRALFITLLGTIGRDAAVRERCLSALASAGENGESLEPSTAAAILTVAVYAGGRASFDTVLDGFRKASDPLAKQRYLFALVATPDPDALDELCQLTLSEIRTQDAFIVLRRLMAYRAAGARTWKFVTDNWDRLSELLPSHAMTTIVGGASTLLEIGEDGKAQMVGPVRDFASSQSFGGQQLLVDQSLERHLVNALFVERYRPEIGDLLAKA